MKLHPFGKSFFDEIIYDDSDTIKLNCCVCLNSQFFYHLYGTPTWT